MPGAGTDKTKRWIEAPGPLVVLVEPQLGENIGAAARAMANFGLRDLVVVDPWEPTWREAKSAVGAEPVLATARVVATLEEAIADRAFVGATTAATRRSLGGALAPRAFFEAAAGKGDEAWKASAVIFGNEKHGLSTADIERCHAAIRIPTGAEQPSMNLAQAVAVCCYEAALARALALAPAVRPTRRERLATVGELEALLAAAVPVSEDARVERRRAGARDRLRRLLLRSEAASSDVALLRGLVARARRNR
jgi:tRNA/rRNA methyltransferase